MKIPLTEPTAPRYIYVNPKTNQLHLLMPLVSGTDIGLDNTCKSVFAVQEFFGKSREVHQRAVLDELTNYQTALELDISLLENNAELKAPKQQRLKQIKEYLEAINTVLASKVLEDLSKALPSYPEPLQQIMTAEDSNVHSMLLRPVALDQSIRFVNPIFSVKRQGASTFYNALTSTYKSITTIPGARARIVASVLASPAGQNMNFNGIQQELSKAIFAELGVNINFAQFPKGQPLNQQSIDEIMLFGDDNPATSRNYIDTLLHYCAQDCFASLVEPVFYSARHADDLSIITQFFMAHVNIYCRANNLSSANFGAVLDADEDLSTSIAGIVYSCILSGANIEDALLNFVNENSTKFSLTRRLEAADKGRIKKEFTVHYAEIKETKEFDEFIVLDKSKPGPFIPYQNAISLNFAEFARIGFPNLKPEFFKAMLQDFQALNGTIPPNNPWIHKEIELSIDALLKKIHTEEQFDALLKKLPPEQKKELMESPIVAKLQVPKFLHCVARGQQKEAEDLLKANPNAHFLLQAEPFTDYSGRTFNCTAYEYAYWAKDKHMCRMLEKYMDEDTKAEMLKRCKAIEAVGLVYTQHDKTVTGSKHFDFAPLIKAYDDYVKGYEKWSYDERVAAWMKVGLAQRDVPAHVIDEYCRPDRSFDPVPDFNESDLPRNGTYYNWQAETDVRLFPLVISSTEGLGVNFALYRGAPRTWAAVEGGGRAARLDLAAVSHLDKVRTEDLKQSLENLEPKDPSLVLV